MHKRKIGLLLALAMIIGILRPYVWYGQYGQDETKKTAVKAASIDVWDGSCDIDWYEENNYELEIDNASQLAGLAKLVNSGVSDMFRVTIKITSDIYLNYDWENYSTWDKVAPENEWIAIGTNEKPFRGVIDGGNHSIYGIYINNSKDMQGLIGKQGIPYGGKDYQCKNLCIKNCYIKGAKYVGGLCGCSYYYQIADCGVENVLIEGTEDYVGGLLGYGYLDIKVDDCHVEGVIKGNNYVGGIVGGTCKEIRFSRMENTYMSGEVSGNDYVGGLAGFLKAFNGPNYCYSHGKVSGRRYVGGLVGSYYSVNASNKTCYTAMEVSGKSETGIIYGQYKKRTTSAQEVYYMRKDSMNEGLCDIGCDEFGSDYWWDQLKDSAVSEEFLCGGEFCYQNRTLFGICLGKDKYPSFVNSKNRVYSFKFYDDQSLLLTKYYNKGDLVEDYQPYLSEGKKVQWASYDGASRKYVAWDFEKDKVTKNVSLFVQSIETVEKKKTTSASLNQDEQKKNVKLNGMSIGKVREKETSTQEPPVIWDGRSAEVHKENIKDTLYFKEWKIYTASELAGICNLVKYGGLQGLSHTEFKLMNDIYLNEDWEDYLSWETNAPKNEWTPIGNQEYPFNMTFDGNNHTIYGLYINSEKDSQGLFGEAKDGGLLSTIKNLTVKNSYIKGRDKVGGIVGGSSSSIRMVNCNLSQSVVKGRDDGNYVGGVAGYVEHLEDLDECSVTDSVISGGSNVGGVIGMCNRYYDGYDRGISKVSMKGKVKGADFVGGIVGNFGSNCQGRIDAVYSLGEVEGERYVGGLFGSMSSLTEGDVSYTACKLKGEEDVGIVCGRLFSSVNNMEYNPIGNIYYPKECYANTGLYEVGCSQSGQRGVNIFINAAQSKEYFSSGKFCNENKDIYGMILGQDEFPQFLNEYNKVLKVQYFDKDNPTVNKQEYYNYRSKLKNYQPYESSGTQVNWYVSVKDEDAALKWYFDEYSVVADTRLVLYHLGDEPKPGVLPKPTASPSFEPIPTQKPTATPSAAASSATPTVKPTATPTVKPTATPTVKPTATPTAKPKVTPTVKPTATPTAKPKVTPTVKPTATPTAKPKVTPTSTPKSTMIPNNTEVPNTEVPTQVPAQTLQPVVRVKVKVGKEFTIKKVRYLVTKSSAKKTTVAVKGMKGKKKKLVIPKSVVYKGTRFDVTSIANRAFYGKKQIQRVCIGANVTKIGKKAFYGTSRLKFIDIRTKKLKSIGTKAFMGIYPTAKIKIPHSKRVKYVKLLANKYG